MLLTLNIVDLAVVKSLNLNLAKGMSVLTGETGAGKSILLTALGLALGNRADSEYVRPDATRAEINLNFDLMDAPLAKQWLESNDLNDDDNCFIRRIVNQDGGSKAYINNRPVTLQSLKQLSTLLVEIHGQHAHLTLLDSDQQRHLLDNFAKSSDLLAEINQTYQSWKQTNTELNNLIKVSADQFEREELLRYQLEELQQLDLENFDYQALSEEHGKLSNLDLILKQGQEQLQVLSENDQQSVNKMLGYSLSALTELTQYSPELAEICEILTTAQIHIEEGSQQLRRYLETQEADPQRLLFLEEQIGIIQDISRKHQTSAEKLPQLVIELETELSNIAHSSERIEELTTQVEQKLTQYKTLSKRLSANRTQNAKKLEEKISAMIKELGMPQGDFLVNVNFQSDQMPRAVGNDKIEFLVSPNPGLPPKPLAKIASGGELSRISLAIQVSTSTDKTTATMIFDEVDSGIGGGIAEIVGQKLRNLSHNRQILCVTHLPQVASQAHQHLYVKKDQSETTSSTVTVLNKQNRIEEIARMLGGVNMTQNTLAHAEEMLGVTEQ
ncbi:MAG: DNA repair protein RecN [Methylococcales symbiont of Hymedesmia sp. n. MRB-2018]|nr:MAG: DNA repair protein RecN [Methylococcales symbiont of Hymedesmia sp. n. MRB-2018]KAF3982990.1 MAG: DNA repair protein RecN [Methylococcales symbiont of Hymedesmia sp. n. MRB-2018]